MTVVPAWIRGYERPWLGRDVVAGLIIWSVVTPQAVAYAQIAGLPPQAGLIAAPGAMLGYALLGSSRTLVVSATTATSGVSAVAVGPLADGDMGRFAALSAALALVTAVVLVVAGMLKLGAITDFVSKPVITGFLFGLGLFITVGQLPALLGVEGGGDGFFEKIWDILEELGSAHGATAAVGLASVALLFAFKRFAPGVPGTIVVLVLAIVVSALLDLDAHGVDVVGALPDALPDPAVPDVSLHDLGELLPSAFGIMILTTEAVGVARALATKDGYAIDVNRELYAMGAGNALSGLTSGFVQSGGASQTAAAEEAGGKSQLASVLAAVLIILTGAFLSPLFEPSAGGDARGDRDRGRDRLLQRGRAAPLRRDPPQRNRVGRARPGRGSGPRGARGPDRHGRPVADAADLPAEPARGLVAGARPRLGRLGPGGAPP